MLEHVIPRRALVLASTRETVGKTIIFKQFYRLYFYFPFFYLILAFLAVFFFNFGIFAVFSLNVGI